MSRPTPRGLCKSRHQGVHLGLFLSSGALVVAIVGALVLGTTASGVAQVVTLPSGQAPVQATPADQAGVETQVDEELEGLVQRMHALEPSVEAEDRARRIARGMQVGVPTTTFDVGLLTVVAREDQRSIVEAAVSRALPFYERTVRGGAEHVFRDGNWVAQYYSGGLPADLGAWGPGSELIEVEDEDGPARMVDRTRELLGARLVAGLPAEFREWSSSIPLIRPGINAGFTWEGLHREAISVGSFAVRACLAGGTDACWSVLGFPRTDAPHEEWYSDEERRLLGVLRGQTMIRSKRAFRRGDGSIDQTRLREARVAVSECRRGVMSACDQMTFDLRHRSPLPLVFRTSLMWHVLEIGGVGAYARLLTALEAGATVPEALAQAGRRSSEELVVGWATRIAEARPAAQGDLGLASLSSLLWLCTLAGVAVRGATRRHV